MNIRLTEIEKNSWAFEETCADKELYSLIEQAEDAFEAGDMENALSIFSQVIDENPLSINAFERLS